MHFRRSGKRQVEINMAPLVDVVFLLVIFFAVSTTFLDTAGLKLELPTSSSTASRDVEELTVLLARDGTLNFNGADVDEQQLRERLRQSLSDREPKGVILRADASTPHGDVVKVMDLIRDSGAESLTVAARAAPSE